MECQARIIEKECGCVIYYLPRINANSKICSRKDAWCYDRIRLAIERTENDTYECQCLPACFDLSFIGDISVTRLGTDGFSIRESDLHNLTPDLLRLICVPFIFFFFLLTDEKIVCAFFSGEISLLFIYFTRIHHFGAIIRKN